MKGMKLLFITALLALLPSVALANAGPAHYDVYPGINIMPVHNNHIKVTEENLIFDIFTIPDDFHSVKADIKVNYQLENTEDQEETVLLAFPFEGDYSWAKSGLKILFDGKEVEYDLFTSEITSEIYASEPFFISDQENLTFSEMLAFVRQEANEGFAHRTYRMKVVLFELTFMPLSTHILNISYTTLPSLEREDTIFPYFIETPWHPVFVYYLEPAKYWADFETLNITIRTPEKFPIRDISLQGIEQVEPGYYQGTFDSLPQNNLAFSLTNQDSVKRMKRGEMIWRIFWYGVLFLFLLMIFCIVRKIYRAIFKKKQPEQHA